MRTAIIVVALGLVYGCKSEEQVDKPEIVDQLRLVKEFSGEVRAALKINEYRSNTKDFPGEVVQIEADGEYVVEILNLAPSHKLHGDDIQDDFRVYIVKDAKKEFSFPIEELRSKKYLIKEYEVLKRDIVVGHKVVAVLEDPRKK